MQTSFQFVKKYYFNFYASCGSTYKIEFAKQIHKKSGRVPDFLYKEEKCARQGAVFLQYSLESVVSSERLLGKR